MCPCATETRYHELLKKYHTEYSSYTASLINSGKYDKDDFTVVFQPFLRDAQPPKNVSVNDKSWFNTMQQWFISLMYRYIYVNTNNRMANQLIRI